MTLNAQQTDEIIERVLAQIPGATATKRTKSEDTTIDKVFTDEAPTRGRGRPPGSKNVKHAISTQVPKRVRLALDELCEQNGTNTSQLVCRILTVALETPDLWID